MTIHHSGIYVGRHDGAVDLSGVANSVTPSDSADDVDRTTFRDPTTGDPVTHKVHAQGLKDWALAAQGIVAYGAVSSPMDVELTRSPSAVVTVAPDPSDGEYAFAAVGHVANYTVSGAVGEDQQWSADFVGHGAMQWARILSAPYTARSTSGSGIVRQLGAPSATVELFVHVLDVDPDTEIVIELQHDTTAGFSSPETYLTLDPFTAAASVHLSTPDASTTDTYWRVVWTIIGDGGARFLAAVAIT